MVVLNCNRKDVKTCLFVYGCKNVSILGVFYGSIVIVIIASKSVFSKKVSFEIAECFVIALMQNWQTFLLPLPPLLLSIAMDVLLLS